MSSAFFFDGNTRQSRVSLARDHQQNRKSVVEEARRQRERREEDRKRENGATVIQRAVRRWQAEEKLVKLALEASERTGPSSLSLKQLIIRMRFCQLHDAWHMKSNTSRNSAAYVQILETMKAYTLERMLQASDKEWSEIEDSVEVMGEQLTLTLERLAHPKCGDQKEEEEESQRSQKDASAAAAERSQLVETLYSIVSAANQKRALLLPALVNFLSERGVEENADVYHLTRHLMLSLSPTEIELLTAPSGSAAVASNTTPQHKRQHSRRTHILQWESVLVKVLHRRGRAGGAANRSNRPATRLPTSNVLDAILDIVGPPALGTTHASSGSRRSSTHGTSSFWFPVHVAFPSTGVACSLTHVDYCLSEHLFRFLSSDSVYIDGDEEAEEENEAQQSPLSGAAKSKVGGAAGKNAVVVKMEISPFSAYCRRYEAPQAEAVQKKRKAHALEGTCTSGSSLVATITRPTLVLEKVARLLPALCADTMVYTTEIIDGSAAKTVESQPRLRSTLVSSWIEAAKKTLLAADVCAVMHMTQKDLMKATLAEKKDNYLACESPITFLYSWKLGVRVLYDVADSFLGPSSSSSASHTKAPVLYDLKSFESLCSLYAWPLAAYVSISEDYRHNALGLITRLTRMPGLVKCLWRVFHRIRMLGETALCSNEVDHNANEAQDAASRSGSPLGSLGGGIQVLSIASSPLRDESGSSAFHVNRSSVAIPTGVNTSLPPTLSLPAAPRPPASVMAGVHCTASPSEVFWSPHPALSTLFLFLLGAFAESTDFGEGLKKQVVLDKADAGVLVLILRDIVYRAIICGVAPDGYSYCVAYFATQVLGILHTLDEAKPFVSDAGLWIPKNMENLFNVVRGIPLSKWKEWKRLHEEAELKGDETGNASAEGNPSCYSAPAEASFKGSCSWSREDRIINLLLRAPYVIPFDIRVQVLSQFLAESNASRQMMYFPHSPLRVLRGRVFQDTFDRFQDNPLSMEMMAVRFREDDGNLEEGLGMGVYRELIVELCKEGFAAENGLFSVTDDGYVYPNPFSYEATGDPDHLKKIGFLGAMVGRAMRDGILQDTPFALHFRNALLGRRNSINNLLQFDPQLYRNLNNLLTMKDDDIEGLGLNFTYTVEALGIVRDTELFQGGAEVAVTAKNCYNYIQRVADFKLNRLGSQQTRAFREGLAGVLDSSWLSMFDSNELAVLFGGDVDAKLDIEDWRKYTTYRSPEDETSTVINNFWSVVEEMSGEQQRKLLKFCTALSRPPLLGFRFLSPPFAIHVLKDLQANRLPSSATCFCLLKLPAYPTKEILRTNLIAAIEEGTTFGLS